MSASLKLIASVVGVTGAVGGVVGATLWKSDTLNSSSTEATPLTPSEPTTSNEAQEQVTQSHQAQATEMPAKEAQNCKSIELEDESIFEELKIQKDDYTVMTCENADVEGSKQKIGDKWTGLFPDILFKRYWGVDEGETFILTSDTEFMEEEDNDYKTTFKSREFKNSSVVGTWNYPTDKISGKSVTTVQVVSEKTEDNEKIYLLFD